MPLFDQHAANPRRLVFESITGPLQTLLNDHKVLTVTQQCHMPLRCCRVGLKRRIVNIASKFLTSLLLNHQPNTTEMSSTNLAEIIDALTAFYQQVAKHPHVGDAVLKLPPAAGWGDEIAVEALRASGKTEAVIDFLKHIPYFKGVKVTVVYDGTPVDYTYEGPWKMDPLNPIPGHCVYLTQGGSIEGLNLILDTEKG